jgi:hypothetical protein
MIARGRYTQVLDAALAQEAVRHSEPRADFGQARKTYCCSRPSRGGDHRSHDSSLEESGFELTVPSDRSVSNQGRHTPL